MAGRSSLHWADRVNLSAIPAMTNSNSNSEQLAIDDKSGMLRDLVVKLHRGVIGVMGQPVHARRSRKPGLLVDAVDQRPADAFAARGRIGEQVLQITIRRDRRRAAMK